MKKISIIIYIFSFSIFVFGQPQNEVNWQTFSQLWEEFTVEVPIFPKSYSHSTDNSSRRYYNRFNNTYFFIFVDSFQKTFLKYTDLNKTVSKFVNEQLQSGNKGKFGEIEGEMFKFIDYEGFYHTVLSVKTPKHFYTFQTVSQNEDDLIASHFFSSLKILENSFVTDKDNTSTYFSLNKSKSINQNEGIELLKPKFIPPQQSNKTSALELLTKPRANYNDYARFYFIEGSVQLRVTFLADGNIGAVSPVTKVPFGLTNNAIYAAKQITFNPAMKNGIPVTVVKQVIYSFTLY